MKRTLPSARSISSAAWSLEQPRIEGFLRGMAPMKCILEMESTAKRLFS